MGQRKKYIAVFTETQEQFERLDMIPRKIFIRIRSINDVLGRDFIGVVYHYSWWLNDKTREANIELLKRFPELLDI